MNQDNQQVYREGQRRSQRGSYRGAVRNMNQDNQEFYREGLGRGHRGRYTGSNLASWRSGCSNVQAKENEFAIKPIKTYEKGSPLFEHPRVVGSYSVDDERNFGLDRSQLKFIDNSLLPENDELKVELDLNKGIDEDKSYTGSSDDTFENMLQWIINNRTDLLSQNKNRLSVDLISTRGCLLQIMKTINYSSCSWSLNILMYNGSVYMKTGKESQDYVVYNPLIQRSGHKFEQYMSGDDSNKGIEPNSEFWCVQRSRLDDIELLYCPAVDFADPMLFEEDFHNLISFVTVKCFKELANSKLKSTFTRYKTLQTWAENKLSGIPRVVFGFRNEDYIVHTLKLVNTEDLPEMAEGTWQPNGCLNFLNDVLKYMIKIASEHPEVVIEFEKREYGITWQVSDHQHMLPNWYTDNIFEEQKNQDEKKSQKAELEEQSGEQTEKQEHKKTKHLKK